MQKEQQEFKSFVESKVVKLNELPVTPQKQVLPLTSLDWKLFEQLCCRLIALEPNTEGMPYLYGVPGEDQKGVDIVAKKRISGSLQTWCYQCKNYQYLSPSDLEKAIEALEYKADHYIFLITCEAGTKLQNIAEENGMEIWDVRGISSKLKYHPDLVADFFGLAWKNAFCIPQETISLATLNIYRPPRPKQPFVGRESELDTLRQDLGKHRVIIIEGVGGVGKTELLLQALKNTDDIPTVWLDVESYNTLSDLVQALLRAFSMESLTLETEQELFVYLDRQPIRIVFDGLDRIALHEWDQVIDFLSLLVRFTEQPKFVVTTQIESSDLDFEAFRLSLGTLTPQASEHLLSLAWEQLQEVKVDQRDLVWLLQLCDGHPLSLRLIMGLIRYHKNTRIVVERLQSAGANELKDPARRQQKTSTSLGICLMAVYSHFNHQQKQLLQFISSFPVGCIATYAQQFREGKDYDINLAELRRFFFVDVREDPIRLNIERLHILNPIKLFIRDRWKTEAAGEAVEIQLSAAKQLMVHAIVLSDMRLDANMSDIGLALVDFDLPNYRAAMQYAAEGKEWKKSNGQDATDCLEITLSIAHSLFSYFFVRTFLPMGIKFAQAGIDAGEELGGHYLTSVLTLYNFLIGQQKRLYDFEGLEKTVAKFERAAQRAVDSEDRALASVVLGDLKLDQHRYAEAVEHYKIAEAYFSSQSEAAIQTGERGEPDNLTYNRGMLSLVKGHLGKVYEDQQEYQRAIEYYSEALSYLQKLQTDFNTGTVYHQLGNCHAYLGNSEKALECYQHALQIFAEYGYSQFLSNSMNEMGDLIVDVDFSQNLKELLTEDIIVLGLNDVRHEIEHFLTVSHRGLSSSTIMPSVYRELHRKVFNVIRLVSFTEHAEILGTWSHLFEEEVVAPIGDVLFTKLKTENDDSPDNLARQLYLIFIYDLRVLLMIAQDVSELFSGDQEEEGYTAEIRYLSERSYSPISKRISKWLPALLAYHRSHSDPKA